MEQKLLDSFYGGVGGLVQKAARNEAAKRTELRWLDKFINGAFSMKRITESDIKMLKSIRRRLRNNLESRTNPFPRN